MPDNGHPRPSVRQSRSPSAILQLTIALYALGLSDGQDGEEPEGLCSNQPNHSLRDMDSFFHTPWLDEAFCRYPTGIHSGQSATDLITPSECLPTNSSVLDQLVFMCDMAPGRRSRQSYQRLHLPFCRDYTVARVFGDYENCLMQGDTTTCRDCMENIYLIDQHAKFVYCHFAQDILARFDCVTPFSVRWNCSHCQVAYRQWLCSMMIPFRMGEYQIKPCRTFCTMVEQRCPYLTPDDKVIIAGEPMFFCKDPDIPELYSAYDDPPHCYLPCHLNSTRDGTNSTGQDEDCARHEFLNEELAIYYNMSTRKTSLAIRPHLSFHYYLALFLLTVILAFP